MEKNITVTITLNEAIETIREHLKIMTDEERFNLFEEIKEGYCPECGRSESRRCYCWNDE